MDPKTIKTLEKILDKNLKPITGKIETLRQDFDKKLKTITKKFDPIDRQFEKINRRLYEHSQKLDSLMIDITLVNKKTDVLPDIHSYVKDTSVRVGKFEERVEILESAA